MYTEVEILAAIHQTIFAGFAVLVLAGGVVVGLLATLKKGGQ